MHGPALLTTVLCIRWLQLRTQNKPPHPTGASLAAELESLGVSDADSLVVPPDHLSLVSASPSQVALLLRSTWLACLFRNEPSTKCCA